MTRILHIAAHLGGGVGKAISGLVRCSKRYNNEFNHTILVLEKPEKEQYVKKCLEDGICIIFIENVKEVEKYFLDADIVILNWWHHPKVAQLLIEFPQIPVRLVLWSHINGCSYPFMPYKFSRKFNHVMLTCQYSYDNPLWSNDQKEQILGVSSLVYGMGEFNPETYKTKTDYNIRGNFSVGYIGTLNYSKLNSAFIRACSEICKRIPDTQFILVGDPDQKLIDEINSSKIKEYFKLTGYLEDVTDISLSFDVFGYPLNEDNFGTTENSILEAMARALPVVALKQGTEQYIIENGKTGFLAADMEGYVDVVEYLYKNGDERNKVGVYARRHVIENYSIQENIDRFHQVCYSVMRDDKHIISFADAIGVEPYEVFLSSSGVHQDWFLSLLNSEEGYSCKLKEQVEHLPVIFKGKTKSSVQHFCTYFPNDKVLKHWNNIIQNNK